MHGALRQTDTNHEYCGGNPKFYVWATSKGITQAGVESKSYTMYVYGVWPPLRLSRTA